MFPKDDRLVKRQLNSAAHRSCVAEVRRSSTGCVHRSRFHHGRCGFFLGSKYVPFLDPSLEKDGKGRNLSKSSFPSTMAQNLWTYRIKDVVTLIFVQGGASQFWLVGLIWFSPINKCDLSTINPSMKCDLVQPPSPNIAHCDIT